MAKRENIDFTHLEKVFSDTPPRAYSDEELLEVITNPETLAEKDRVEQLRMVAAIAEKMTSSEDFQKKVLEGIEKLRYKPNS